MNTTFGKKEGKEERKQNESGRREEGGRKGGDLRGREGKRRKKWLSIGRGRNSAFCRPAFCSQLLRVMISGSAT